MHINDPAQLTKPRPQAAPAGTTARLQSLGVSRREAQVLALLLAPYSNAEIASRLGIGKRTVESHIAALLRKLDAPDRHALIRAGAALFADPGPETGRRGHRQPLTQRDLDKTRTNAAAVLERVAQQQRHAHLTRNVRLERDSIKVHEAAAQHLDELAARWHSIAMTATDHQIRGRNLDRAAAAHQRAQAARSRATRARQRHADSTYAAPTRTKPAAPSLGVPG